MPYKNKEIKKEYHREYMNEYNKTHLLTIEQKAKKLEAHKIWREKNREKLREYGKKRYQKDREKIALRQKVKRDSNVEFFREKNRIKYHKNRDEYRAKMKIYRLKHKAEAAKRGLKFTKTPKGRLHSYRSSAKIRGHSFEITDDKFYELLLSNCHYCSAEKANGIDRKDSNIGYTDNNATPCCKICNYMKGTMDYKEFIDQSKRISNNF